MPSPLEDRARALAVGQNFGPEALELNRRLVAANPADAGSRTRLARCYLEAGRLEEAEAEYRQVLQLDPRNRIAAGGLQAIEEQRRRAMPADDDEEVRAPRRPRAPRVSRPRVTGSVRSEEPVPTEPVPQTFNGFGPDAFAELAKCRRREIQARFAPRVIDLLRRVNALTPSVEIAGIREPGKKQLFRARVSDVHAGEAHWSVFNLGGRWELQWNIGMYGGGRVGDWFRIGLGMNLDEGGTDPDRANGIVRVREELTRFQQILESPRGSLFLGWMVKENGLIQRDAGGPLVDVREPSQAVSLIAGLDPDRTEWLFFGKWLRPDEPADAEILSDPVALVRTIERVFAGLLPLFRAMHESGV